MVHRGAQRRALVRARQRESIEGLSTSVTKHQAVVILSSAEKVQRVRCRALDSRGHMGLVIPKTSGAKPAEVQGLGLGELMPKVKAAAVVERDHRVQVPVASLPVGQHLLIKLGMTGAGTSGGPQTVDPPNDGEHNANHQWQGTAADCLVQLRARLC